MAEEERRKYPRFSIHECTLSLQPADSSVSVARALIDLSEGGIRVYLTQALPVGTRVRVRLVMKKYADEVQTVGEVRWCRAPEEGSREFTAGIMFVETKPENSKKIANIQSWLASFPRRPSQR